MSTTGCSHRSWCAEDGRPVGGSADDYLLAEARGDSTGAVLGKGYAAHHLRVVSAIRMWLGNEFEFRRPSLEREVQLDVCVHCSSCVTLCVVVHSPLVGSTIVIAGICVAKSCGWSFTPDGTYDSVWDCVMPMIGRYTIYYFQYQGDVEYVCMLNEWIASSTKFALTITTLPSSG